MYAGGADRIVDMQFVVDEFDSVNQYDATYKTNHHSTHRRHEVATGGDTDKTCQHTIQRQ